MSQSLLHPAVAAAQARVADLDAEFGTDFTPTAIRIRGDAAAIVMDSTDVRFIVVVERVDGEWTTPSMVIGSPRPDGPRAERTAEHRPLQRLSRKRSAQLDERLQWPEESWWAVTGLAAQDAAEITVVVDGEEIREPIGHDGLAFAFARVRRDCEPEVIVHTLDGRSVTAVH